MISRYVAQCPWSLWVLVFGTRLWYSVWEEVLDSPAVRDSTSPVRVIAIPAISPKTSSAKTHESPEPNERQEYVNIPGASIHVSSTASRPRSYNPSWETATFYEVRKHGSPDGLPGVVLRLTYRDAEARPFFKSCPRARAHRIKTGSIWAREGFYTEDLESYDEQLCQDSFKEDPERPRAIARLSQEDLMRSFSTGMPVRMEGIGLEPKPTISPFSRGHPEYVAFRQRFLEDTVSLLRSNAGRAGE